MASLWCHDWVYLRHTGCWHPVLRSPAPSYRLSAWASSSVHAYPFQGPSFCFSKLRYEPEHWQDSNMNGNNNEEKKSCPWKPGAGLHPRARLWRSSVEHKRSHRTSDKTILSAKSEHDNKQDCSSVIMSEHGPKKNTVQTTQISKHPYLSNPVTAASLSITAFASLHSSHLLDKKY